MRFLINTITPRKTSSSINLDNTEVDAQETEIQPSEIEAEPRSTSQNIQSNKTKQNKQKETNLEKKFMQYLDAQTQKEIFDEKPDEHQHFFNSLLPIIRKFNDDETLIFRTEVLRIAQTIKQNQISSETLQPQHTASVLPTHHPQYLYQASPSYRMYPNNNQFVSSHSPSIQHQTVLQHMNFQHNTPVQGSPNYPIRSTYQNYASSHQPIVSNQNDTSKYFSAIQPMSTQHSSVVSPSSSNYTNIESPEDSQPNSRSESQSSLINEFLI